MVDPDQRRRDLAHATWRVIRREGVEHASVRTVAREAGLSAGSLRHYFGSQTELLAFAMATVMERVEHRVAAVPRPDDPLVAAKAVLAELLPLDDERAAENEVWLAFTARALADGRLRELRDEAYDRLQAGCAAWIARLLPDAGAAEHELESERLFALVDGLAVHAALRPASATPARLAAVLDHHLEQVVRCAGSPGFAGD